MAGEREVKLHDRKIAARIARAALSWTRPNLSARRYHVIHREAPAISKDPVADNTDRTRSSAPTTRARSRSSPTTCRWRRRSAARTSSSSATTSSTRINIDNDGDGDADIIYEFAVRDPGRQPEHVPLQHRPDPLARQRELEPQAVLHGHPDQPRAVRTGAREPARLPAVQHRAALDPELRRRSPRRRSTALPGGADRVRRPAGRGLLRRPRVDLRPRRPAAVREPAREFGLPALTRPLASTRPTTSTSTRSRSRFRCRT